MCKKTSTHTYINKVFTHLAVWTELCRDANSTQMVNNLPVYKALENSFPCSPKPTTASCFERDYSSTYIHAILFQTHLNVSLPSMTSSFMWPLPLSSEQNVVRSSHPSWFDHQNTTSDMNKLWKTSMQLYKASWLFLLGGNTLNKPYPDTLNSHDSLNVKKPVSHL
jgi:hypothetical protein